MINKSTISKLTSLPRTPHFYRPLGNLETLKSFGVPEDKCHILDWWESRSRVEVSVPTREPSESETISVIFDMTCTPGQHNVGRNFMDSSFYSKSLWSGWVVPEILSENQPTSSPKSIYFAGDTGYRAVLDDQNEVEVPVCEAFKQIGERFDGVDLAILPSGATPAIYVPYSSFSQGKCVGLQRYQSRTRLENALGNLCTNERTYHGPAPETQGSLRGSRYRRGVLHLHQTMIYD
ncbi:hypothetical protein E1B28_010170 [Marasmius oreades]|uniref:Uncharacterized protein n=1 Tax=Marasmius oreades TaxID=181124 RepID=A0A9P7RXR8_9AGAR|nr:uncharacterized protein E1B28_010170 [Marasmius oreades]KAG7091116.1 hypothetical protein E1B28_010170 [Marasmius oreades]